MATEFGKRVWQGMWVMVLVALVPLALAQDARQDSEAGAPAQDSQQDSETGSPPGDDRAARPLVVSGAAHEELAAAFPGAAVWLEVAEERRVLVLFRPEDRAQARGAVLVLADEGQGPAAGLAGALARPLTAAGWAVMNLGLAAPPLVLQQAREAFPESLSGEAGAAAGEQEDAAPEEAPGGDGATDTSIMIDVASAEDLPELAESYREQVQSVLAAALAELRERGYERLVLVGIGRGASHATRQAVSAGGVDALVWIAADFASGEPRDLAGLLEDKGSWPLLDLYSSRPAASAGRSSPAERAADLRRGEVGGYQRQPVAMAPRPVARDADQVASRLTAWLARD